MKAPLTDEMLDLLEEIRTDAERRAYHAGYLGALRDFAREYARLELLGPNWREQGIADHRASVQARKDAALEQHEARVVADNIAAGRHPGYRYRGGPVDWMTGLPARSWCAQLRWIRRQTEHLATVTPIRPAPSAQPRQVAA